MKSTYATRRGQNFGRPWSDHEIKIITTWYTQVGIKGVQAKLKAAGFERTERAVLGKAHRMMLWKGDMEGWTPVASLVSSSSSGMYYRVLFAACQENVLRTLKSGTYRYLVPDWWAEEYDKKRGR